MSILGILNYKKCKFIKHRIKYLGYKTSDGIVLVDHSFGHVLKLSVHGHNLPICMSCRNLLDYQTTIISLCQSLPL